MRSICTGSCGPGSMTASRCVPIRYVLVPGPVMNPGLRATSRRTPGAISSNWPDVSDMEPSRRASSIAQVRLESGYHAACRRSRRGAFVIAVTPAILIVLVGGAAGVALLAYRRRQQGASDGAPSAVDTSDAPETAPEKPVDDAPYSTDAIQAAQDESYRIAFGVK